MKSLCGLRMAWVSSGKGACVAHTVNGTLDTNGIKDSIIRNILLLIDQSPGSSVHCLALVIEVATIPSWVETSIRMSVRFFLSVEGGVGVGPQGDPLVGVLV